MKRVNFSKNQGGFSLIELLLAFAVIAGVIVVVMGNFGQGTDTALIEREKNRVLTIKRVIADSYGSLNSYTGINNTQLLAGSKIPSDMRAGAGEIQNSWLDAGYVVTATNGGDTYTITSNNVPDDYCYDITVAINPATVEFETLTVNGNAITNPADAQAQCTNGNNAVAWTGRR